LNSGFIGQQVSVGLQKSYETLPGSHTYHTRDIGMQERFTSPEINSRDFKTLKIPQDLFSIS